MSILFVGLGLIGPLQAEETTGDGNWDFTLAPVYLWAVSLDGDVAFGQQENSVSLDFGDIFDNLEAAFIVHFETIYKRHFGFMLDINYIDISGSGSTPVSEIDLDLDTTIAEAALYYRWYRDAHTFDIMAGALYSNVEQDVKFSNLPIEVSASEDWTDPIISLRWTWDFADRWGLTAKGGVGGFGVSSDLIWEGIGLLSYQPWKHAQIILGYRAVGIDYETGYGQTRFVYDVTMTGPLFGIGFVW